MINSHRGILHKICNIYFISNPNKEDYYQEILIRLWKSYPGFKKQSAFSTWMYKVALNTAIDIIRKQNLQPKLTELSDEHTESFSISVLLRLIIYGYSSCCFSRAETLSFWLELARVAALQLFGSHYSWETEKSELELLFSLTLPPKMVIALSI